MKPANFTGTVTQLVGNQVYFKTGSAATYRAETGRAELVRRNGAIMTFQEIAVGDKINVRGTIWPDNSMNAIYIRDMSLYTHTSTFRARIVSIDPSAAAFIMYGRAHGSQTVRTDSNTSYKKNGSLATFRDLQIGYTVSVKGMWDRSRAQVLAKDIQATVRLVGIEILGRLTMKGPAGLTVVGENQVIYGVDIGQSKLLGKTGKAMSFDRLNIGDTVRVKGKHLPESVSVIAATVKDMSIV